MVVRVASMWIADSQSGRRGGVVDDVGDLVSIGETEGGDAGAVGLDLRADDAGEPLNGGGVEVHHALRAREFVPFPAGPDECKALFEQGGVA